MFEINSNNFKYTALFCEENIWHLANELIQQGVNKEYLTVLFISNNTQSVAIFNQKSGKNNDPVIWDYHVVLLRKTDNQHIIYDFDSKADFGIEAKKFFSLCCPPERNIASQYQMQIRTIPSKIFLQQFSSDRSHMLGVIDTNLFPDYPPLSAEDVDHSLLLKDLINFKKTISADEKILSLAKFHQHFLKNK